MKTAKEIIQQLICKGDILDAMQEYADQQSDYWKRRCEAAERYAYHLSARKRNEIKNETCANDKLND